MLKTLVILLFPLLALSQESHSIAGSVHIDHRVRAGARYIWQLPKCELDVLASANHRAAFLTVKLGVQAMKCGDGRLMLYPLYFDYQLMEGYRTPSAIQYAYRGRYVDWFLGVDLGLAMDWLPTAGINLPLFRQEEKRIYVRK